MSPHSAGIASTIRSLQPTLSSILFTAIESSIVGNDEVPFINSLVPQLDHVLGTTLRSLGVSASTRSQSVHGRPLVDYVDSTGVSRRCELADILFVVKYQQPGGGYEARYALYQAKCARTPASTRCAIDPIQLELLRTWPSFSFGLAAHGGPVSYAFAPLPADDFGSYVLMQRRPALGGQLVPAGPPPNSPCYGWITAADAVHRAGPVSVDFVHVPSHSCPDEMLFEQLAFSYGEPDGNPNVKALVDALYRYVGLLPDPPAEFDGYQGQGAFWVLECRIEG